MSLDDRTAEKLTPEERRTHLRAFADRMLLKVSAMDDPEDVPGVEKAVRVAASIERIYYRCDRAERQTPDPRKLEAERATHQSAAIKARVHLAGDLEWGEMRRKQLGKWWDAAETTPQAKTETAIPAPVATQVATQVTVSQPAKPQVPPEALAAQGADLLKRLSSVSAAVSNKAVDTLFEKTPQSASDVLANANRILKMHAALERGDITEDELDDFDEELDDWLQGRTSPS